MPERREDLGTRHQFHGVQPVLPVEDVATSAAYFRDMLGFEVDFLDGDPPVHARVMKGDRTYGDPVYIHLTAAPPERVRPSGEIRIHVGHDLDGPVVRADQCDVFGDQPFRRRQSQTRLAGPESLVVLHPELAVTGVDEDDVAARDL